jgi:hypothetical protein
VAIVMKLTERDLKKRYSAAGMLIADLQSLPSSCAASPASESLLAMSVQQACKSDPSTTGPSTGPGLL